MPWFDMPLQQLREYRTSTPEPEGLDEWWAKRLEAARAQARPAMFTPHEPDVYAPFEVSDVEFSGADGDPIRAWYIKPAGAASAPVVVKFIGYGGGRGAPSEHMLLPALGYAVLVMDSRGQGGRWTTGATPDGRGGTGAENSLVMTRGIASPEDYYYTRMFTDAARAVDVALELAGPGGKRRGHRRQPGRRARARLRRAAPGRGQRVPRGRPVPLRHPAGDHPRAALAVHRDPRVPRGERRAHRHRARHAALHRLRAARPPDHRHDAGQRRADGRHLPAVDRLRRLQRDQPPDKDIVVYPYSGHSVPHAHAEPQLAHLREHFPA